MSGILSAVLAFTSTMAHGQSADEVRIRKDAEAAITRYLTVPLMLPAGSEYGQSFVRLKSAWSAYNDVDTVHVFARDDSGLFRFAFTTQLATGQSFHFNSDDLTYGNAAKGIEGIGPPRQGDWQLHVETPIREADIEVSSYVRTRDGFLTATDDYDVLPHTLLVSVNTFNPASNVNQQSRLRLINPDPNIPATIAISGTDDSGNRGHVSLTLGTLQSRTLTAIDLEEGAEGLEGALGDGTGKWQLNIHNDPDYDSYNGSAIVVQNLLYASSGHISNLSTSGYRAENDEGDHPDSAVPMPLDVDGRLIIPGHVGFLSRKDGDFFRFSFREPGRFGIQFSAVAVDADYNETPFSLTGALLNSLGEGIALISSDALPPFSPRHDVGEGDYYLHFDPFFYGGDPVTDEVRYTVEANFAPISDRHGDTMEDATSLDLDGRYYQWGAINADGDVDWFRIVVTESSTLELNGYGQGKSAPLTAKLYDSAGNELGSDSSPGDQGSRDYFNITLDVAEGTYFGSVEGSEMHPYRVWVATN